MQSHIFTIIGSTGIITLICNCYLPPERIIVYIPTLTLLYSNNGSIFQIY